MRNLYQDERIRPHPLVVSDFEVLSLVEGRKVVSKHGDDSNSNFRTGLESIGLLSLRCEAINYIRVFISEYKLRSDQYIHATNCGPACNSLTIPRQLDQIRQMIEQSL